MHVALLYVVAKWVNFKLDGLLRRGLNLLVSSGNFESGQSQRSDFLDGKRIEKKELLALFCLNILAGA